MSGAAYTLAGETEARMMEPVLDKRSEQELLLELRRLAGAYVPDWRFCEDMTETGSVIVKLFAELMGESVAELNKTLERNREAFLKSQGLCQKQGSRAEGTMVFGLVKPDMPPAVVPRGAVVLAKGKSGQAAYETLEEVFVTGEKPGKVRVRAVKPGADGNLPAGGGHKLECSAGFVSDIKNPLPITGGTDGEPLEAAMERCEAAFRHRYRAVTPGDYESLVRERFPEVKLVRCFPGYNGAGSRTLGAVTVVVLQEGNMEGERYLYGKTEEIREYLTACAESAVQQSGLSVVLPEFVRMDILAELYTGQRTDKEQIELAAKKALETFLHPLKGGFKENGWHLGILPPYGQIKTCLERVGKVRYGRRITVEWKRKRDGAWEDMTQEEARRIPWSLPVNGEHRILVKGVCG